MSTALPSDEVAEDYKNSLEDLVSNDRYQISTLMLIAKENIEHAEAISRVLQNHINRAPPSRKLPALYVLDSIVKNVGSPYTIYFGRNLFQTFMHAYSQVDSNVRKKLEEMLKTWREPAPGALSSTPVFPISSTQLIVDQLQKFRAATTPAQRYQQPNVANLVRQTSTQQYRNTPTPPLLQSNYPSTAQTRLTDNSSISVVPTYQNQGPQSYIRSPQLPTVQPYPSINIPPPQPTPPLQNSIPHYAPRPASSSGIVDIQKLHVDIDDLTTDAKIKCATHPMDQSAQKKLATLQTLKEILDSGAATENDLIDIRNSIMQEMAKKLATRHHPASIAPTPDPPFQQPYAQPQQQPPLPSSTPALPAYLNSASLAELLRATAIQNPVSQQPPNLGYNSAPIRDSMNTPTLPNIIPSSIPTGALPLLAHLRASGLLSAASTPPQGLTPTLPSILPLNMGQKSTDIPFTSAAMKQPRPQLVTTFLNSRPNQCSTCGRRFTSDETGREKKARHLDWHFKTKARMIEAEKRGQNRSWYVDEREWIASREYDDDTNPDHDPSTNDGQSTSNSGGGPNTSPSKQSTKKQDFVRTPADPLLRSLPCPIDQEPFKSEWSEDVQDFIWKDAIQVGGRYYHASCYQEVTRAQLSKDSMINKLEGGTTPLGAGLGVRTGTPDSVTRKRKAEEEANGVTSKVKFEI